MEYIVRCRNFDGGFGSVIGAESHAAQGMPRCSVTSTEHLPRCSVFVCVAALSILDRLDVVDEKTLCWWLSERQLPNGGLNGRPEKLEDVSAVSSQGHNGLMHLIRFVTVSGYFPRWPSSRRYHGSTQINWHHLFFQLRFVTFFVYTASYSLDFPGS